MLPIRLNALSHDAPRLVVWHPTIALALQTKAICHANGNTHSVLKGVADAELPLAPPRTEVEVLVVNGALYLHRTGTARHPGGDARDVPRALVLVVVVLPRARIYGQSGVCGACGPVAHPVCASSTNNLACRRRLSHSFVAAPVPRNKS